MQKKRRIYIEIGNVCNLSCAFCPGNEREKRQMTPDEFRHVMTELSPLASEIYLHILGEPLLHPSLSELLSVASGFNVPVSVTTNGSLLQKRGDILLSNAQIIRKVSISLQSHEANLKNSSLSDYMSSAIAFAKKAAELGIYSIFRLWNLDSKTKAGLNTENGVILSALEEAYPEEWEKRYSGYRLSRNTFLECAEIFEWPRTTEGYENECGTCHGLVDQIGVLADGSVVPCCLDCEGDITLGNIFSEHIRDILSSDRAAKMLEGLKSGHFTETLCRHCTYARRFSIHK